MVLVLLEMVMVEEAVMEVVMEGMVVIMVV